ncbi:hypothetical protein GCM10027059_02020 [Myceligenerans halotolerans]
MTVTDPVTPGAGSESAGTAATAAVSAAPPAPAVPATSGPWAWLAIKSVWAFVQAAGFGLAAVVLTLYIWAARAGRMLARPVRPVARFVWRRLAAASRALGRWCWGRGRTTRRLRVRRRVRVAAWLLAGVCSWLVAGWAGAPAGDRLVAALAVTGLGLIPGLARATFAALAPRLYLRFDAWTFRRGLAAWVRREWPEVADKCGLAVLNRDGTRTAPKIKTTTALGVVNVRVPVLTGQTTRTVLDAANAVATAYGAHSFEVRPDGPARVVLRLFLTNALTAARTAVVPAAVTIDGVPAGVRLDGARFDLRIRGRHTLVVGASGAGKGSVFWSVVGGLAPAITARLVQVWAIDMKKGVEAAMGEQLFHATAYTHARAIAVLRALVAVIEERGTAMRGISRLHQPTPGDPLHVLIIDELADLLAYSDFEVKREAERLLSIILTQGRALGVVAVGCVQNPRQEALGGTRNLWTQRIALRLDSDAETDMVLGSRARTAPADLISRDAPGTAYTVNDDDGTVSMVRFDYWPDDLVRHVAALYPAPDLADLAPANPAPNPWGNPLDGLGLDDGALRRRRSPRKSTRDREAAKAAAVETDNATTVAPVAIVPAPKETNS